MIGDHDANKQNKAVKAILQCQRIGYLNKEVKKGLDSSRYHFIFALRVNLMI